MTHHLGAYGAREIIGGDRSTVYYADQFSAPQIRGPHGPMRYGDQNGHFGGRPPSMMSQHPPHNAVGMRYVEGRSFDGNEESAHNAFSSHGASYAGRPNFG